MLDLFRSYQRRSRTAATSKMEYFVIIVNGWKPLTIITKSSILDVAAVLDPPLHISKNFDSSSYIFAKICFLNFSVVVVCGGGNGSGSAECTHACFHPFCLTRFLLATPMVFKTKKSNFHFKHSRFFRVQSITLRSKIFMFSNNFLSFIFLPWLFQFLPNKIDGLLWIKISFLVQLYST